MTDECVKINLMASLAAIGGRTMLIRNCSQCNMDCKFNRTEPTKISNIPCDCNTLCNTLAN